MAWEVEVDSLGLAGGEPQLFHLLAVVHLALGAADAADCRCCELAFLPHDIDLESTTGTSLSPFAAR
jgi:hypothetical protein